MAERSPLTPCLPKATSLPVPFCVFGSFSTWSADILLFFFSISFRARLIKEKDDIDHYLEQNFKGLSKEEVAA